MWFAHFDSYPARQLLAWTPLTCLPINVAKLDVVSEEIELSPVERKIAASFAHAHFCTQNTCNCSYTVVLCVKLGHIQAASSSASWHPSYSFSRYSLRVISKRAHACLKVMGNSKPWFYLNYDLDLPITDAYAYLYSVNVWVWRVVERFFDLLAVQRCRRLSVIYLQQRFSFSFCFILDVELRRKVVSIEMQSVAVFWRLMSLWLWRLTFGRVSYRTQIFCRPVLSRMEWAGFNVPLDTQ